MQLQTQDFHLGGVVYDQVKELNTKIESLRSFLMDFLVAPTCCTWVRPWMYVLEIITEVDLHF